MRRVCPAHGCHGDRYARRSCLEHTLQQQLNIYTANDINFLKLYRIVQTCQLAVFYGCGAGLIAIQHYINLSPLYSR
jgi:hypothetical protein